MESEQSQSDPNGKPTFRDRRYLWIIWAERAQQTILLTLFAHSDEPKPTTASLLTGLPAPCSSFRHSHPLWLLPSPLPPGTEHPGGTKPPHPCPLQQPGSGGCSAPAPLPAAPPVPCKSCRRANPASQLCQPVTG